MFNFDDSLKEKGLNLARDIAEWICNVQSPWTEGIATPGAIPFSVDYMDNRVPAPSWNYAFASMGMAAAYRAFGDERYRETAVQLGKVLGSLQILDPFHKKHHGGIRELSPLCPWCYTRDATSGGWGFVDMYRFTGEQEYLERAKLFGKWLIKYGLDEEGYPWGGVQFEPPFRSTGEEHTNAHDAFKDLHENCEGGCLNFFYQIYKATNDKNWCEPMKTIADIFVDEVQQDSGFFTVIDRKTKEPLPNDDVYNKLHRGNDDLGTLGLLCTYHVTKDERYLASIKKFLDAAWSMQEQDGLFEDSVAATPVILNITYESQGFVTVDGLTAEKIEHSINALFAMQKARYEPPFTRGALAEYRSKQYEVTMRANCYALIVLLKLFAGVEDYLCD